MWNGKAGRGIHRAIPTLIGVDELQSAIPRRVTLRRGRLRSTDRDQNAVHSSCRSRNLQRTANFLSVCVSPGGDPGLLAPKDCSSERYADRCGHPGSIIRSSLVSIR